MGLFTELLLLPLAPVRGVTWVAEKVAQQVEHEMYDPGVLRAQIDALDAAHERGEISEADRDEQQEELLQRLVGQPCDSRDEGPDDDGSDGGE